MRLTEVERGDGFANRLLISFISVVSGMRLPDAARVAFYHKDFFGSPMGAWTQAAMRGPSPWSVAERELMACMVAKWNACAFCVGAHGAVAAKEMQRSAVDEAVSDFRAAPISGRLKSALAFLEVMTLRPKDLKAEHARAALDRGLKPPGSDRRHRGRSLVQHRHAVCGRTRLCDADARRIRPRCKHASQERLCFVTPAPQDQPPSVDGLSFEPCGGERPCRARAVKVIGRTSTRRKGENEVSWFQESPAPSLELIAQAGASPRFSHP